MNIFITFCQSNLSALSALQGPGEADPLWGQLSGLGHARDRVLVRFGADTQSRPPHQGQPILSQSGRG
jgi:hypothetical protein